jgi:serine/threonine protein kinase
MGEVYEGFNINTDERVAIKVMLPHLAEDPHIQALFRKEARTLLNLSHPALVQYRVLAREPSRELLYIVTDFIEGSSLFNLSGRAVPTLAELVQLTRRLAEGLHAAHLSGAVHRDMSPDNVLLPGGDVAQAKIIDFGIAKSLEAEGLTVVGDGFAGKFSYVAPEQFGDFGRRIGPWTDIYSLGLVVLAYASGHAPELRSTLVEAIDRQRAGIDISDLAEPLQPLFARMLKADPAERLQSMADVIAELDAIPIPAPAETLASSPGDEGNPPAVAASLGEPTRRNPAETIVAPASWGRSNSIPPKAPSAMAWPP